MAINRGRPSLATWQVRLRARRRRRWLAALTVVATLALVTGGSTLRFPPALFGQGAAPVADIGTGAAADTAADTAVNADTAVEADTVVGVDTNVGRLAPDERGVAVVAPLARLPLEPDDRVDVVAIAIGLDDQPVATILSTAVRVLRADDDVIVLALPRQQVGPVLAAQAGGPIELVLNPDRG